MDYFRFFLTDVETSGAGEHKHPTGPGYREAFCWAESDSFVLFYGATCQSVRLSKEALRVLAPTLVTVDLKKAFTRITANAAQQDRLGLPYDREDTERVLFLMDLEINPPVDVITRITPRVRTRPPQQSAA